MLKNPKKRTIRRIAIAWNKTLILINFCDQFLLKESPLAIAKTPNAKTIKTAIEKKTIPYFKIISMILNLNYVL